jgi:hypothetical protein
MLTRHAPQEDEMQPTNPADGLLVRAREIIAERRETYGPPAEHFSRTIGAINAIFGHKLREPLTAADWAAIMILDKISRHQGTARTGDNMIDGAGYFACMAEVEAG